MSYVFRPVWTALLCLILGWPALATGSPLPEPLQPAERQALLVVSTYLDGGADAVSHLISPSSELGRLGVDELAIRFGPRDGSEWTLGRLAKRHGDRQVAFHVTFASGIEDLVVLELDRDHRRLVAVRTLADSPGAPMRTMAPIAEERRALLATGNAESLATTKRTAPVLAAIRRLWLAQHHLLRLDPDTAAGLLERRRGSVLPLERLLRARLAGQTDDPLSSRQEYGQFFRDAWDVDVLRYEMARATRSADDVVRTIDDLEAAQALETRDAEIHYDLARYYLFRDLDASEKTFRTAWTLRPMERSRILEDPFLAYLLGRRDLFELLRLDQAEEPAVGVDPRRRSPIRWPAGARLHVSGRHLVADVGSARLVAPGGAVLAPAEVRAESAAEMRRRENRRLVDRLPETIRRAAHAGALDSPRFVRRMEHTAAALADAHRWNDLLRLTAGLRDARRPPAELARWRAEALEELSRPQEALTLLVRLATDVESAQNHPRVHFHLARLCADHDRPDLAVGVLERLSKLHPFPGLERPIRRFQLDVDLKVAYEVYESTHFRLRHAETVDGGQAIIVAGFLEAELERLQEWIPYDASRGRIEVHLVPAKDFYRVYGGGVGILGLYDGKIRLPVFDVDEESAVMTEVVSHELAHAMIDRRTQDRAPKWFHEGLAQLVEPDTEMKNPYRAGRRVIAFPLVEPVLQGFNESQFVGLAYGEAYWTLRYVEERHGKEGIGRLLDAFANRATSEEALRRAFSQAPAEFDRELQRWARSSEAPLRSDGLELDYDDDTMERMAEHAPGLREEIERQAEQRPAAPKVGLALEGDTPEERFETLREKVDDEIVDTVQTWMEGWYEVYRSMADPIRNDLRTIVLATRGIEQPKRRVELICRDLAFQITPMVTSGVETIDEDVTRSLRAAYLDLSQVVKACSRGEGISDAMKRAEAHLSEAAYHLEKYGMKP